MSFLLVFVAEETGLSLALSKIPNPQDPNDVLLVGRQQPVVTHILGYQMAFYLAKFLENTLTIKPVLRDHSKENHKLVFKTDYRLMHVKSIAKCSKSILQYF